MLSSFFKTLSACQSGLLPETQKNHKIIILWQTLFSYVI